MGDRTRDDVITERVNTGKRVVDARDRRRRTREGEGLGTGSKTVSDPGPERAHDAWLPDEGDS
jgi:hypothetical protein